MTDLFVGTVGKECDSVNTKSIQRRGDKVIFLGEQNAIQDLLGSTSLTGMWKARTQKNIYGHKVEILLLLCLRCADHTG